VGGGDRRRRAAGVAGTAAHAQQQDAVKEIERYREVLAEGDLETRLVHCMVTLQGFTAAQRYVYVKVYNSHAFAACSTMPRFGHQGILTEAQIAHLVALLLDPASPVNR
jgi:hypothetical protein